MNYDDVINYIEDEITLYNDNPYYHAFTYSQEAFINNKIAEFGFTTNNATINYKFLNGWKSAIFSVSLLGNSKTYILQYNESTRK
jgi:hypothetical protein